ncbi:MAG TPA: hypothetical protein EYP34_00560 [Chromatiaceae bacterium]|nr:hypothetical protein [Chromatiaceae bacterium]
MKILAIIINLFFPGIGTLLVKKWGQAIGQIILGITAVVLMFTGIGSIIGMPLAVIVWIWAIVTTATANPEPVTLVVQHKN